MPANLTNQSISEVYPSFLHFATSASGDLQRVYDGVGTGTSLYLSTTSLSIDGTINLNNVRFNVSNVGIAEDSILVWNNNGGSPSLNFKPIVNVLAAKNINIGSTGIYSSPVITISNGIISNIYSSGNYKMFYIGSRYASQTQPDSSTLISQIQWLGPVNGDRADVMQKVYTDETKTTLQDIKIYTFTFNGSVWNGPTIY